MPDIMAQTDPVPVRVTPLPFRARMLLRGAPVAIGAVLGLTLPTTPCTAQPGDPAVLWLGPDEWLLLAAGSASLPLWDSDAGAAFDITHRQAGLLIEGSHAADAIAAACPLNLSALPVGGCTRTVFGKAEIILWRRAATSIHLETWRSFVPYVRVLLTQSIQDLG